MAVRSYTCSCWLRYSSNDALRSSSLVYSACPLSAMLSAVRAALRLESWSILVRRRGSSRSTTRIVSTLCTRSSLASQSDRASILREYPSTLRWRVTLCSSFAANSLSFATSSASLVVNCPSSLLMDSFFARSCRSNSSILVVACWYCLEREEEEFSCRMRDQVTSRSDAASLVSSRLTFPSRVRIVQVSRVRSASKEAGREEQSCVIILEVREEFSRMSAQYLLFSSEYCQRNCDCSPTISKDCPVLMPPLLPCFHSRQ